MVVLLSGIVLTGHVIGLIYFCQRCNALAFPLQDCQSSYIDLHLHTELRTYMDRTRLKNIVKLFLPTENNATMKTRVAIFVHKLNGNLIDVIGFHDYKTGQDLIGRIGDLILYNDSELNSIKTAVEYSRNYLKENEIKKFNKIQIIIVLTRNKSDYSHKDLADEQILVHVIFIHKSHNTLGQSLNEFSEQDDFSSNNLLSAGLCGQCWPGWFMIRTKKFHSRYRLEESETLLNHESALKRCNKSHSTLFEVESEEEFLLVQQKLSEILKKRYRHMVSILFHIGNCDVDITKLNWYQQQLNTMKFQNFSRQISSDCGFIQLMNENPENKINYEVTLFPVDRTENITNFFLCENRIYSSSQVVSRRKKRHRIMFILPWDVRYFEFLFSQLGNFAPYFFECNRTKFAAVNPPWVSYNGLPYAFVCDGIQDCEDGSDERMCAKPLNTLCEGGKSCSTNLWMNKREDVCLKTSQICDGIQDCLDNSDEEFCDECLQTLTADGSCLPTWWFEPQYFYLKSIYTRRSKILRPYAVYTNCINGECLFQNDTSKPVTMCDQPHSTALNRTGKKEKKFAATCYHFIDRQKLTLGCSDNLHLKNCRHFRCPKGFYKCLNSYCILNEMTMDGVVNCPAGDDENVRDTSFYCRHDHHHHYTESNMCNGRCDCLTGCDDEMSCHKKCPLFFNCQWGVATMIDRHKDIDSTLFHSLDENVKLLHASGFNLSAVHVPRYIRLDHILEIHLSNCSLNSEKIAEIIFAMSSSLYNVYHLDLSYNKISLEKFDVFSMFFLSLRILNLSHTSVSKLHINMGVTRFIQTIDLSYTPLTALNFFNKKSFSLLYLNLSSTPINTVGWFDKDMFFGTVDLRNTKIDFSFKNSKSIRKLIVDNAIYGDSYKLCCDKFKGPGIPSHACKAQSNTPSLCENLIDNKRTLIWLVALIVSSGNAVVIGYRIFYEKNLLKQGYRMFVTNLGLSDLIMSVYLLIIAGADVYYRDDYVLYDTEWRDSSLCKAAGFLATLSTETSLLFLLLITIDRYFTFKNPLNQTKFTPKVLACVVTLIWSTGLAISTIPILFSDWQVYSSNAVCLALPVNLTHALGWISSSLLYTVVNFIMIIMIISGQMLIFKQITMPSNSLVNTSAHRRREITVAKKLSLVVVSNILCWFPICLISLMSAAGNTFSPDVYGWLAVAILPLNSAVNPILYTLPVAYKTFSEMKARVGK